MGSKTAVVTIGRNINDRPMSGRDWADFRHTLRTLVKRVPYFAGTGEGFSEEWGDEEAFTLVFELKDGAAEVAFRAGLQVLRELYGQDAAALTIGITEFI